MDYTAEIECGNGYWVSVSRGAGAYRYATIDHARERLRKALDHHAAGRNPSVPQGTRLVGRILRGGVVVETIEA